MKAFYGTDLRRRFKYVLQLFIVVTRSRFQAAGHKEPILTNRRRRVN
jgi:hypothetical protein